MTADVFRWPLADWYALGCALALARVFMRLRDQMPWLRAAALILAFTLAYFTTSPHPAPAADPGAAVVAFQYRNPLHWVAAAVVVAALWRFSWPRRHWGSPARVSGWPAGRRWRP